MLKKWLQRNWPGTAQLAAMEQRLTDMQAALTRIERLEHGGRATFVGNGRVLTRAAFPDFMLSYLVEADDRLIAPFLIGNGIYEPDVTNHFLNSVAPTDHCVDLGANIGYFSCIMARLALQGKVIAVEADPQTHMLLRDNLSINFVNIQGQAVCGTIADTEGELVFYRRLTRSGNTSIIDTGADFVASLGEPPAERFTTPCFTVDSLLDRMDGRIDHIKIDVEGSEPLAFRGMARTLETNPGIRIVMEWAPIQIQWAGFDLGDFLAQLQGLGLKPQLLLADGTPHPISYDDVRGSSYMSGVLLTRA